jgi:hypothetical protein
MTPVRYSFSRCSKILLLSMLLLESGCGGRVGIKYAVSVDVLYDPNMSPVPYREPESVK